MEDNTSSQQHHDDILPNQQSDKENAPQQSPAEQQPSAEQQSPAEQQSQNQDASQKLVLPGQQPTAPTFHSDTTQIIGPALPPPPPAPPLHSDMTQAIGPAPSSPPLPNQPPGYASSPVKKWRMSAIIAWTLVAVLASTLLFFFIQSALGALGTPGGQASPTTSPTLTSRATTPAQNAGTITITPSSIQTTRDCQVDHGYRCTITLMAQNGSQSWQAQTLNLRTKFHPHAGTLQPGQQQQIILYISNQCPYTGQMLFTAGSSTTSVLLQC